MKSMRHILNLIHLTGSFASIFTIDVLIVIVGTFLSILTSLVFANIQLILLLSSIVFLIATVLLVRRKFKLCKEKRIMNDMEDQCTLSSCEKTTYINCKEEKGDTVSFENLLQLKKKFVNCAKTLERKEKELVDCLERLMPQDKNCLVHISHTKEDTDLANEIRNMLKDNACCITDRLTKGLELNNHLINIIKSCKCIIIICHNPNDTGKFISNYKFFKSRRQPNTRLLVCSSKKDVLNKLKVKKEEIINPTQLFYLTTIIEKCK